MLDGEGIGPELVGYCRGILEVVAARFGSRFDIRTGGVIGKVAEREGDIALPQAVRGFCREVFDAGGAVFAGAGGSRFVYDMRQEFSLFMKLNPLRRFPEIAAATDAPELDLLVVRENLAGLYQGRSASSGVDGRQRVEHRFSYDEQEVAQITSAAARIAASRRGRLTIVAKEAGLPEMTALWFECGRQAARDAGVEPRTIDIDYASYALIATPAEFDVLVAPNCFGDILADIGGLLCGSRGMTYGSSHSLTGAGVYQTNHGAAYDMVGLDRANPAGQILALAMMLRESFALETEADAIEAAVRQVWGEGYRTDDLAAAKLQPIGTRAFVDRVMEHLIGGR